MIVLYKILESVYEASSKCATPVMIVGYVLTPKPPHELSDDELHMLHYNFIHKNKDEQIQRLLKEINITIQFFDNALAYDPVIITYDDPIDPNKYLNGIISMSTTHSDEYMKRRLIADDVLPTAAAMALDGDQGPCLCCALSESIYGALRKYEQETAINCPHCGKAIAAAALEPTAVQEANYYSPQHHIGIYPVSICPHCGEHFAMIPTPIAWNANHDVYYTGGADYMVDHFEPKSVEAELYDLFAKYVFPDVKQYVNRKLSGETSLSEWNLKIWTERGFAKAFSEYFYNHGLKE